MLQFGCMVFDSMIAPWFFAGAPSFAEAPPRGDARRRCVDDGHADGISCSVSETWLHPQDSSSDHGHCCAPCRMRTT